MLAHVIDYADAQRGAPAQLDRSAEIDEKFSDRADVASWAAAQVALMTANGIMGGRADGSRVLIAPLAQTTLQEAVTLTVKLHDVLK